MTNTNQEPTEGANEATATRGRTNEIKRAGTCHVFGDNVSLDEDIIPGRFAAARVTDPQELLPHLFENLDPQFAARVRRGDIIVAGREFACGKPRLQGLIALSALELCIVCESIPYKILRRAVGRAIPVIVGYQADAEFLQSGDRLEIDFASGQARNLTRGGHATLPAMPPVPRDIVAGGGAEAMLRAWLVAHPEQGERV